MRGAPPVRVWCGHPVGIDENDDSADRCPQAKTAHRQLRTDELRHAE
jgi:hypothetical protein